MGSTDRFSRREFQRILDVTDKQLSHWEKLGLLPPRKSADGRYDFRDLISVRTAKQLMDKGVSPSRLRRSLAALEKKLAEVRAPLTELRILSDGGDVIVERNGTRLEPISGQFVLNFDTRELQSKVRVIRERTAEDWFAAALEHEARDEAAEVIEDAYERALGLDARHLDALINLGMLHYERGSLEKAAESFSRAVEVDASSVIAQFNLGSVLEELGKLEEARRHLRLAVRLDARYADAHYNLGLICEKLGASAEAREHWRAYLQLDATSPSAGYARQRLMASGPGDVAMRPRASKAGGSGERTGLVRPRQSPPRA